MANKETYFYRWNYQEQLDFDNKEKIKKRRNSTAVYVLSLGLVFCICFLVLGGALIWYQKSGGIDNRPMNIAENAEKNVPGTVVICTTNGSNQSYETGFLIRSDGIVVTSASSLQDVTLIQVHMDGYEGWLSATVLGQSLLDDVAVLKLPTSSGDYPTVSFADSKNTQIGDEAVVIGCSSVFDQVSVFQGSVSGLSRKIQLSNGNYVSEFTMDEVLVDLSQKDVGAPVFNSNGKVIGMVDFYYENVACILPSNGLQEVVNRILNGNTKDQNSSLQRSRPLLGITCQDVVAGNELSTGTTYTQVLQDGVYVTSVDFLSCASGSLQVGDVIVSLNGKTISSREDLLEQMYNYKSGDKITLKIQRGSSFQDVSFKLY